MHVDRPLAIYVHLPWCVRKCPYCDFNSHALKSTRPDPAYIDALLRDFEAELPLVERRRVATIFLGGGTPSLFLPEDVQRLLQGLKQRIEVEAQAEVTMEANPGTIERGRFKGYREAGINRVSLGAQTFGAHALQSLGRIHSADDSLAAVAELLSAGIDNFNLDLMYALPDQSVEAAMRDVRMACELGPTHISYYQLTLEPGTVFHAHPPALPDEETAWQIQSDGLALLGERGYRQYEVSAHARPGFECRHNLNYWLFGDYVGIGAGAHGKVTVDPPGRILRTAKPKQPGEYLRAFARPASRSCVETKLSPQESRDWISAADLPFEYMLNALRLNLGFATLDFEQATGLPASAFEDSMRRCAERGLTEVTAEGWRPTALGRRFLNDLQIAFLP